MGAHFTSTIDVATVKGRVDAGAVKGLRLAVEHLLTEANKSVPHDEGTLERSGSTSVDAAAGKGSVSYDTPYAVRQHEDLTLSHDGKGQAKWLEATMASERSTVGRIIAQAIQSEAGA